MNNNDFLLPKGITEEIIVKDDDDDLIKSNQFFLDSIGKEVKKYNKRILEEEKRIGKVQTNKKSHFTPEFLSKKSPLTIINAPWGSGKTYFIESLARNFEKGTVESNIFKKIVILDVWKYSNSKNVPEEIMSELFDYLSNQYDSIKDSLKSASKWLFNSSARPWLMKFGLDIQYVKEDEEKYESLLKKINKEIDPTIIVFDNLEGIGNDSWEVLKAIYKLSTFENFVFVLPMNYKHLSANKRANNTGEFPIEKYTDIATFEFKQDYLGLLKKIGFKNKESIFLNKILDTEISGQKLSIREAEQRIHKNNLTKISGIHLIKEFTYKIWGSKDSAVSIINDFVEEYKNNFALLKIIYDEFKKIILTDKYINNISSSEESLIKIFNNYKEKNYDFLFNYPDEWKKIISKIEKIISEKKIKIKIIEKEISELLKINEEKEISIKENYDIVDNREDEKKSEELKGDSTDEVLLTTLENGISKQKQKIDKLKNFININKEKIEAKEEEISYLSYVNSWNDIEYLNLLITKYINMKNELLIKESDNEIINNSALQIRHKNIEFSFGDPNFSKIISEHIMDIK